MSHQVPPGGMVSPEPFQRRHQQRLEKFFQSHNPKQEWGFGECAGFIFAVQCAPEMVPPSDWLPMALDDIEFPSIAEGQRVTGALLALYNWIGERIEQQKLPIPPGYEPRSPAMDNFDGDNPLGQWGRGLMVGHGWLEKLWDEHVPDHEELMSGVMMPVMFLSESEPARELYRQYFDQKHSFDEVAARLLSILPQALIEYAEAGRRAYLALMQRHHQPARSNKVGRNEPCPCGSGKKYKKCCLGREQQEPASGNPASNAADELLAELGEREFASHNELDTEIRRITEKRNRKPLAEFDGLTPEQMFQLLNHPFESPELVNFADCLETEPDAPILGLVRRIIDGIGDQGLKATAKGNLPRAFCIDALDEHASYTRPYRFAKFIRLRSEINYPDLHHARIVAELAGLIEVQKGRFRVTGHCREMLTRNGYREVYPRLFQTFATTYNWAYGDRFAEALIVQRSFAYTLYLLSRHGESWQNSDHYEDAILRAFPEVLDELEDDELSTAEDDFRHLYRFRVLVQFAEFLGLIEIECAEDDYLGRNIRIRNRLLLKQLVQFWPQQPDTNKPH